MKNIINLLFILPLLMVSQHKIEGNFQPATDFTYAFLYHSTPTGANYIDRAQIQTDGSFKINLDSTAAKGIYKIVYALPPEENNFDIIYSGEEDVELTFSLNDGLEFTASNENKLWSSYIKSMGLVNTAISNFYTEESTDEKAFKDIFKTLKETQQGYENASKGTLVSQLIKANTPYIPDAFEDISTYSKNLKRTYLQHVDFNNEFLQSSDFLEERVTAYLFGMTANSTDDTYKSDLETIVNAIGDNTTVKLSLLQTIWQQFIEYGNDTMANYVSDTYLLDLAKATKFEALIEALETHKKNSIGQKAQNFDINYTKNGKTINTTLHDLNGAEQYLIIFWSSTCGHCLEELPKVKTIIPQNTKVIAIGLEDDDTTWLNEIKNYPNFIQTIALGKWDNPTVMAYGVSATPTYILLDKNKIIIAKPDDLEALEEALK